jgi:hypothetical protein
MADKGTGGQAFPHLVYDAAGTPAAYDNGMTLRDYFAAQALATVLTSALANPRAFASGDVLNKSVCMNAYAIADAMLAERSK